MVQTLRITLFKLPDPAVVQQAIQKYTALPELAVKDGVPYIQMSSANATHNEDPRAQNYTLVARTMFACKADMDFYDKACAAHAEIKAFLTPKLAEPPLTVYMDV